MPPLKRYRTIALAALLIVLAIYYIANGAHNTVDSPFYRRTVAAIQSSRDAETRQRTLAAEKENTERRERVKQEHEGALAAQQAAGAATASPTTTLVVPDNAAALPADAVLSAAARGGPPPIVVEDATDARAKDDRVVQGKPVSDTKDGVAKVGNVETQRDSLHVELDQILAKAPLVIFSKSYCPYSKKAKHVLLDLYTITPTPYVVELDLHEHGAGLQRALDDVTHRSTVPNVLVNSQSIGGGDDIVALHERGELIPLITKLGGANITSVVLNPSPPSHGGV